MTHTITFCDGQKSELVGPTDNLIFFDLDQEGSYIGIRPSGTEPKLKIYLFTYEPAENLADLKLTREAMSITLAGIESDIRRIVEQIA